MEPQSTVAQRRFARNTSQIARSPTTFALPVEHIAQGARIKALRKAHHLKQPQVIRALEEQQGGHVVGLRGYQLWESSTAKKPKGIHWQNAVALARFFKVSPESLATPEASHSQQPLLNVLEGEGQEDSYELDTSQLDRMERKLDRLLERTTESAEDDGLRDADDQLAGQESETDDEGEEQPGSQEG